MSSRIRSFAREAAAELPEGLRGRYQLPDSTMTLGEGLAEYYAVNPGLSDPATIEDPASARYFRCHDSTHVFFATHTGKLDEAVNDLLTLFAVDVRYRDYVAGFFKTEAGWAITKTYLDLSLLAVTRDGLRLLPHVRYAVRRMTRRWPWDPPERWFQRPLAELRREFGYEPFNPTRALASRS